MSPHRRNALLILLLAASACGPAGPGSAADLGLAAHCARDNGGITLPDGFCAIVVADGFEGARHIDVADDGDVYVARLSGGVRGDDPTVPGGVTVLRDLSGDGRADTTLVFGTNGGNDVLVIGEDVLLATNDAVLRYRRAGGTVPSGPGDTIVSGLPDTPSHNYKSVAVGPDGGLFVNIGAPSNACMVSPRTPGSPGRDPCPELERRGGIWRFDTDRTGQTQGDGTRYATGLRNTVALAVNPADGQLYGVVHGRDQLYDLWPHLFTVEESAEKPSEELVRIDQGSDFGWPYCYHDPETGMKVLAPEYGGEGDAVGRCADKAMPIIGFPGHWAPNDMAFYVGDQFPERYRGGAFIAFHGSWNRAPLPQDGYRVVFVPAGVGGLGPDWEVFADDFMDEGFFGDTFRPVGLAVGPDGSLYVSDSVRGRVWRVVYRGT